ncbi:(4Fe-4S)-binding protein [bacterium SCSIO 12741]|nr:(4Fe-4S)-binding protein [bacterium SCSIO 12741]
MSKREITKHYENEDIRITWKPSTCIHSTICWKGLIQVFNPKDRPWVKLDGASSERIAQQIDQCPSQALSYEWKKAPQNTDASKPDVKLTTAKIAGKTPVVLDLEAGKPHAWCACGLSENQPWCNGAHKGTSHKPLVFKEEKTQTRALCMCKRTSSPPFCDGSHNHLD